MKSLAFAKRNMKELFRDPLSILLGIVLPLGMFLIFVLINKSIYSDGGIAIPNFNVENMSSGMIVFGFSFLTMFLALTVSKDKKTTLLMRLKISPMNSWDFITGYTLPMVPIAILQILSIQIVAFLLGQDITFELIDMFIISIIPALFSIFIGLLIGSIFTENQVLAIGNLYIILGSFLSGVYMDIKLIGGIFEKLANILPFYHFNKLIYGVSIGDSTSFLNHLYISLVYFTFALIFSILSFKYSFKKE
jgi:ABC-2 type transport system permease protein